MNESMLSMADRVFASADNDPGVAYELGRHDERSLKRDVISDVQAVAIISAILICSKPDIKNEDAVIRARAIMHKAKMFDDEEKERQRRIQKRKDGWGK